LKESASLHFLFRYSNDRPSQVAKCLYETHAVAFLIYYHICVHYLVFYWSNPWHGDPHFRFKLSFWTDKPAIRHILSYFVHITLFIVNIGVRGGGAISNTLCGQNLEISNVKLRGIYSDWFETPHFAMGDQHWFLKWSGTWCLRRTELRSIWKFTKRSIGNKSKEWDAFMRAEEQTDSWRVSSFDPADVADIQY
jgi:hypothetical protein